jgi:MFS transporter, DHA1 family, inner membrane transport protein
VLGSAELMVVGVLNLVTADLRVSIPAAGTLVTDNALGLGIGGPVLTALTIKLNRRTVLAGTLIQPGIAFGSFAAGVALGNFTASATVLAGLVIAAISIVVALGHQLPQAAGRPGEGGADPRGRVTQPGSPLDLEGTMTWRAP